MSNETRNNNLKFVNMDDMTDEELDNMYRPKKMNSRKSLAPVFIYHLLINETNKDHHLKQSEIIVRLAEYPYEINIERKAVGRIIHLLADSGLGIFSSQKYGVWHDVDEEWPDEIYWAA